MATQWFYMCMGEVCGPCSSLELRALAARRTVMEDSLVRKGTEGGWVPASRVKGLFDASVGPQGTPPVDAGATTKLTPPESPTPPPRVPRAPPVLPTVSSAPAAATMPVGSRRLLLVAVPLAAAFFIIAGGAALALLHGTRPSLNPIQSVRNVALQSACDRVIQLDERNQGVRVAAYFRHPFNTTVMVFDLEDVSGRNSRSDVFRVLIDFAEAVKEKPVEEVELAFRGMTRFTMSGSHFRKLGEERRTQNPMYTIRTFPENLKTPDGRRAYPEWTGGILGVVNQQMEEFNDVHDKWYLESLRDAEEKE